jgi:hypothetical protein
MRTPKIPDGAEIIRTYQEYGEFVDGFFDGHYHLLIVMGRPGISKTTEFEHRTDGNSHLIKGWVAPMQAYFDAFRHRNKLLIFDDAEVLWKRPGGRILLRALCEHKPVKTVQWTSTAKELKREGVPQQFNTSSKVAIIANQLSIGGEAEREAVLDRGHLVYFDPTPLEVHSRAADWYWDQQIYDYVGERLHVLNELSARIYLKAWERKRAKGNWKKLIEEQFCHDKAKLLVQGLEVDPDCKTVEQRVAKFVEQTSLSRATYFNLKRSLKNDDQLMPLYRIAVPQRNLRATPPNDGLDDIPDAADQNEVPASENANWDSVASDPEEYDPADWWKKPWQTNDGQLPDSDEFIDGQNQSTWLLREMKKAIDREDYERAAEFRDMLERMADEEGEP